jgi:ParB family chromosome partitioning protein
MAAQKLADTGHTRPRRSGTGVTSEPAPAIQRVQNLLTHRLATRVQVNHSEKKGQIQIEYYGTDDLNRILDLLGVAED